MGRSCDNAHGTGGRNGAAAQQGRSAGRGEEGSGDPAAQGGREERWRDQALGGGRGQVGALGGEVLRGGGPAGGQGGGKPRRRGAQGTLSAELDRRPRNRRSRPFPRLPGRSAAMVLPGWDERPPSGPATRPRAAARR